MSTPIASIIVPVKNEPYLPILLADIKTRMHQPYEVLVQTEKGLGYAVSQGIQRANGSSDASY